MGRRKKRIKVRKRRTLGPYFQCPVCGSQTLAVRFERDKEGKRIAMVTCGTCGLNCSLEAPERAERIDIYNRVSDMAYEDRLGEFCSEAKGEVEEGEAESMEEYAGEEEVE